MQIRTMQLTDYEQVYHLWLVCPGMGLNTIDESKEGIARFLTRNPDSCFVAENDREISGAILVGQDGRRAYIYHLAVHPDYRGKGIGSALVKHGMEAVKKQGITKICLVAFSRNEDGNAFWEKLGFKAREDLTYRDKALCELIRIDT